jgi:hypothetical protein
MRKHSLVVVGATTGLLALALLSPGSLVAESSASNEWRAIEFRESVGFRADQAYVEWAAVDRQAFPDVSTGYP